MIRTIEDFVQHEYPNHRLQPEGLTHDLAPFTAVGEFTTTRLGATTARQLSGSFGEDKVAVVIATPPPASVVRTGPEDTDSMADVPKRRPMVGALALGIVALVAIAVVTLIIGGHPAVIIVCAVFAAILGGIEGAIIFGGARFAGEKAWDQQNAPEEPIEVAAVLARTEPDALEACKALSTAGATNVRIVNESGAWHLPNLFTRSE
jgi:hypothetical protein